MDEPEKLEEIEIVVSDEPRKKAEERAFGADDVPEIVVADADAPVSDELDPQTAIEKLQKKLKKERERRKEAEQTARNASYEAQKASYQVEDSNLTLVVNAIETLKLDGEYLKSA